MSSSLMESCKALGVACGHLSMLRLLSTLPSLSSLFLIVDVPHSYLLSLPLTSFSLLSSLLSIPFPFVKSPFPLRLHSSSFLILHPAINVPHSHLLSLLSMSFSLPSSSIFILFPFVRHWASRTISSSFLCLPHPPPLSSTSLTLVSSPCRKTQISLPSSSLSIPLPFLSSTLPLTFLSRRDGEVSQGVDVPEARGVNIYWLYLFWPKLNSFNVS